MDGRKSIAIIGGGFTGAVTAIHLARSANGPLEIFVIEPRDEVGRGVAYSATDPDHRINAPAGIHYLYPEDPDGMENWLRKNGGFAEDPDIAAFDGSIFPRRGDFGAYVHSEVLAHMDSNPSGSILRHIKTRATGIKQHSDGHRIKLESGADLEADLVIVATSNEEPLIPPPFSGALTDHASFVANPWDLPKLAGLRKGGDILVIGAGLTSADVIVTLLRDNQPRHIDVVSRHGIRPTSRPTSHAGLPQPIWERMEVAPAPFPAKHGPQDNVLTIMKLLRQDIAKNAAAGIPWQPAFDDLRDSLRSVWIGLPLEEKRRFLRHLRRVYDSCRFRYPPQTEAILKRAEGEGLVTFHVGQIATAHDRGDAIEVAWQAGGNGQRQTRSFDAIVNCVGVPARPDKAGNAFLESIIDAGLVRVSPLDVGLDVDGDCHAFDAQGQPQSYLFVLGPLTFAQFGYPLGVPFILHQAMKAVPVMLTSLENPY